MYCRSTNLLLNPISHRTPQCPKSPPPPSIQFNSQSRRQLLLLLTATTAVTAMETPSMAADIGLFGLRKKLKKAAEKEVSFGFGGGLTQAGVVVGAEAVGVLVATSIVNGILGPESS
uniref:Putative YCF37-like protein n=1 Tax=Helianthus annuus TaxID=4232 RepID=A0A251T4Y5_HELAN